MPVSSRNIIPVIVVSVILLFTIFNVRLYYRTTEVRAHNRALILQQDSIRSVHMNLTREMLDFPRPTIHLVNEQGDGRVTTSGEPAVLDN
ncbi:MAG: hypothetical protein ACO1NW_19015 [Chitinophagaceae bacterium]